MSTKALLDSGASISCISETFFDKNQNRFKQYEIFPLSNISITTATGNQSKKLKKIVYIETNIDDLTFHQQYLIVPNLIMDVILGIDSLNENKAEINFETNTCILYGKVMDKNCQQKCQNVINQLKLKVNNENTNNHHLSTNEEVINNSKCNHKYKCYVIMKFIHVTKEGLNCHISDYNPDQSKKEIFEDCEQNFPETILEIVENIDTLDTTQKSQLKQLLLQFPTVFSNKPGLCNKFEYDIKLKDYTPFKGHYYPIPACYQKEVARQIQELINDGIIERSDSPYINPILVVPKKDQSVRLCLDARSINTRIVNDYETNRGINEILSQGKNTNFLSTIDLTASYWQIPLSPNSRRFTAFQFQGRTYHFTRIPFGISISQAALLRAMDKVFGEDISDFLMLYIDDALIHSPSFPEHLNHLYQILSKLKESNMTVKLNKSMFCRKEVPFLGYIFTTQGLKPDPQKISAIKDFPIPKSRKQLKAFIGLVNFYNRFCERYSDTIQPLMKLTSKTQKFNWTEKETDVFNQVKALFIETQLHHPDCTKPFYLQTDCSNIAIGGHLYQLNDNGDKKAIMFISRTLKTFEIKYTTTELECLAIVHCLNKVRHIILGNPVRILTDHKALIFLKTCKLLTPRLTRWILSLEEYNYTISYCPGKLNTVADVLSRTRYEELPNNPTETSIYIAKIEHNISPTFKRIIQDMPQYQSNDEIIKAHIQSATPVEDIENMPQPVPKYIMYKGLLYKFTNGGYKLVIPSEIAYHLIKECHEFYLHCGIEKCLLILQEYFTFTNMHKKIRKFIRACDSCQKCKHSTNPLVGEAIGISCTGVRDMISIDFVGPLPRSNFGTRYILITLDNYSKFIKLYPLKNATTRAVINKLFNDYIPTYGKPTKILSDNGTQFRSHNYVNNLNENNIKPIFIPIRHPKMNMSERYIQNVKRCLRTLCHDKQKSWYNHISLIENCLNEIPNHTTGCTPNYLQLGIINPRFWHRFLPDLPINQNSLEIKASLVPQRIRNKQYRNAEKFNNRHKITEFSIGDLVLIKSYQPSDAIEGVTTKLFELYSGPHTIIERIGKTIYNVQPINSNIKLGPYHVSSMKKYHPPIDPNNE